MSGNIEALKFSLKKTFQLNTEEGDCIDDLVTGDGCSSL